LPAQKIVIIKAASAEFEAPVTKPPISLKFPIAKSIATSLSPDYIADIRSASVDRSATIPSSVARIMTVDELVQLFLLATASTTALRGCHRRQGR
jgi:hypothetical protein